jgi:crescentin
MISNFSLLRKRKGSGGESGDGDMPEPMQSDVPMIREKTERPETAGPVDAVEAVRALGTYHEGLRNRSETALNSLKSLRTAAEEMEGLFTEFGEIARQLHLNKRELSEIKTSYGASRKLNEELRAKLSSSQAALLRLQSQIDEITSERDLLLRMRNELSDAHKTDQISLREADARAKVLENELAATRTTIENLTEKADHLSVIVGENEKQLHELREERKLLQSSVDFEVAERIRFSKLHDEVVTSMQSQRRALGSATEELDKARDRVMKLEARQSELLGEREELQASLQTAETLRETDAKNYEIRLEALTSRARLAEHLLEKARDEQRSNFRDQTAQAETQRHMRRLESEVEGLKQELQDTARRNKELEKSETQLQARVEELSIQLRGHVRSSEQSSEKIRMQQEVIEALHKRHAEYLQQVEEQTRKLNEQLENERADRTYLEGALNSARRERNFLQSQLIKIKGKPEEQPAGLTLDFEPDAQESDFNEDGSPRSSATVEELRPRNRPRPVDPRDGD